MTDIIKGARDIKGIIQAALENNNGALIGRNGSTEIQLMIDIYKRHLHPALSRNAGIFPMNSYLQWQTQSIYASQDADILATGWYKPVIEAEQIALKQWGFKGLQMPLRSLEPYYVNPADQWTNLLSGHRVAVVSSFTETMKSQIGRINEIWPSGLVPPIDWCWVQTGYPPSVALGINEWPAGITSWTDAVDYVVSEVVAQGARFALIGCGGLGMPIAKALKDRGIIAIVLGGAIQNLFGIKGRRWATHEIISGFWNHAWVWPSANETPGNARAIEGACYWL